MWLYDKRSRQPVEQQRAAYREGRAAERAGELAPPPLVKPKRRKRIRIVGRHGAALGAFLL